MRAKSITSKKTVSTRRKRANILKLAAAVLEGDKGPPTWALTTLRREQHFFLGPNACAIAKDNQIRMPPASGWKDPAAVKVARQHSRARKTSSGNHHIAAQLYQGTTAATSQQTKRIIIIHILLSSSLTQKERGCGKG